MPFEPSLSQIDTKYKKMLGVANAQSSIVLTATNDVKINKVLSVSALPCIENINLSNGTVTIEGKVNAQALVRTTEKQFVTLYATGSFSSVFNNASIQPDSKIFCCSKLLNIENIIASENSINFVVQVEIDVEAILQQSINFLQNAGTAQQKMGEMRYSNIIATLSDKFEISQEIETPTSISQIVGVESTAILDSVSSADNMAILKGEICSNLIYLSNDEVPKLKCQNYQYDFNQEILLTGVKSDDKICGCLQLCNYDYEVQGELGSSKAVLNLKNNFKFNLYAEREDMLEVVVDAYCPRYELNLSYQSFINQNILCKKQVTDKIDGSVILDDESVRIDKVIGTSSAYVVTKKVNILEEAVQISGTVYTNVIYLLDDDDNTLQSIQVELPFDSIVECEKINSNSIVKTFVNVKDVEARNKKSKEIDVLADLIVNIVAIEEKDMATLSDIQLGDKRKSDGNSMSIYVVNNAEDVWSVGKMLLVEPDLILKQNPELKFPIEKPTQILIYRQNNI